MENLKLNIEQYIRIIYDYNVVFVYQIIFTDIFIQIK